MKAHEVWRLIGIPFASHGLVFPSFVDFLWRLKFGLCLGDELLKLVAKVAWCMWFNQNEVRVGKAWQQASTIV